MAASSAGVSEGPDRTFTTRASAAASRFYEQVSPVAKGGSDVNGLRGFYATPDGEGLMYQWKAAPAGGNSAPVSPRSFGWRGLGGWPSLSLDAPQAPGPGVVANPILTYVLGIAENGSKVVTNSLAKLAPGAVEGDSNLYLHDTRTGAYTTIVSIPGTSLYSSASGLGGEPIVDGTPDYSHILIRPAYDTLLPEAPEGALYEWAEGHLRLASIGPEGSPIGSVNAGGTAGQYVRDPHYISDDGSRIFFESLGTTFVRIDGEKTLAIGGRFAGASRDGHYAFVTGTELTPNSEPGAYNLYRFDTETGKTELLTPTGRGNSEGILQVSANGDSIFFVSSGLLAPGASGGALKLYVWHAGEVDLIATMDPNRESFTGPQEYMASPSGRYFAFGSYTQLSSYDNSSETACVKFNLSDPKDPATGKGIACRQVYRYDVETGDLVCASCPRDGSAPTGNVRLGTENVEGDFSFPRSMLDNGRSCSTPGLAVRARSNSKRDVYSFDEGGRR